jgi:uncharacterized protein YaiL (DUF2058 family)
MMSDSIRDQLLKLGVATPQRAREAGKDLHRERQRRAQSGKRSSGDSVQTAKAEAARAAKAARDRELNRQREADVQARARWAEIKQLIEKHRVPKADSYDYFNFEDRGKIRRIAVDPALRTRILSGELTIVRCEGRYDLVPAAIGDRIRERNERAVIKLEEPDRAQSPTAADDPYKDFVVPDDLRW